jgi:predicted RNA-binding protein with TRAM domain
MKHPTFRSVTLITLALILSVLSIGAVLAADDTPGCQKNNPGRPDCSSLEVTAVCEGTTAVFTITNTGEPGNGDMVSPTQYRILVDGTIVETGSVQLAGGDSVQIRYTGSGTVTLQADQQPGHPGSSQPQATLNCGGTAPTLTPTTVPPTTVPPTATFTPEPPTATITVVPPSETPTEEVLPTEDTPQFDVYAYCDGWYSVFVVTNLGADMPYPEYFTVTTPEGIVVLDGSIQLASGDHTTIVVEGGYPSLTLTIGSDLYVVTLDCDQSTAEATPPDDNSSLLLEAVCVEDGYAQFTITNLGGDMLEAVPYAVRTTLDDWLVDEGSIQLMSGETLVLSYPDWTQPLYLIAGTSIVYADCVPPTAEPTTEAPTATNTPVPPTSTPLPPTATSTLVPTSVPTQGKLGCQKNNPDRLDCSSLEVTATCQAGAAVFTIRNTGEAGEGNMVSPTQYRILVNNVVVQTGAVQLAGGATMQVTYSSAGKITLQADQQIGHPGKSKPQATVTCSK